MKVKEHYPDSVISEDILGVCCEIFNICNEDSSRNNEKLPKKFVALPVQSKLKVIIRSIFFKICWICKKLRRPKRFIQ